MIISSRQKLQSLNDYTVNMNVDGVQLNQTTHSKSLGRPPYMTSRESGYLFPCTLQLKYTKVLLNHTCITVVLSGMACSTAV